MKAKNIYFQYDEYVLPLKFMSIQMRSEIYEKWVDQTLSCRIITLELKVKAGYVISEA